MFKNMLGYLLFQKSALCSVSILYIVLCYNAKVIHYIAKTNFYLFFSCDLTYLLFLDSLELCCNFATFN